MRTFIWLLGGDENPVSLEAEDFDQAIDIVLNKRVELHNEDLAEAAMWFDENDH